MPRKAHPFEKKGEVLIHPPPFSPLQSFPTPTTQPSSSSDPKISPAILLVIVILAIIFFVCGFLHLLIRFLAKRPSIHSISLSRRFSQNFNSDALQRQLQELFRLHDSGLDQNIIDSLPMFCYKKIVGLKEPFDCAVCLCEFADQDQLRLLPNCSHAFHINCIDTWLLSNSTCPLCRDSLENQFLCPDHYSRELSSNGQSNDGGSIYSVRLGKFRSSNLTDNEETSNRKLDARRCYLMGACEYVIDDSDLMVSLNDLKMRTQIGDSMVDGDVEAKRISNRSKGESFSASKIWQWSKKGRFTATASSLHTNVNSQLTNKVEVVQE